MSFVNWLENIGWLLLGGFGWGFFTKTLSSIKFRIRFTVVLTTYSMLYFIGYLFHTDELNAFTIHLNSQENVSVIGSVLLVVLSWVILYMVGKFNRK